ncbi:PIN domain-containing protein [uncultured Thiodictyon sp.]|uniref:PIN domain-containing protein n=1 Tax=uncultured Thiodictyon sp. TaxID=1846217 RepID=UPI0025CCC3B8|nr:PIN domain-containing protein [uncultured Thiodictyon sp.]
MIKTYVDANTLIAAFRGDHPAADEALGLLGDSSRTFVASAYLRLETLRKPLFYRRENEIAFMERYFSAVSLWVPTSDTLVEQALQLAAQLENTSPANLIDTTCLFFDPGIRPAWV